MANPDNIEFYDANAQSLADRYDRTTTEKALPVLVRIIEERAAQGRVLDIGSGAGRDAFWFAEHGWIVDSIDASASLLAEAKSRNPHVNIHYFLDRAPKFSAVKKSGNLYDMIVMSAFLFHFDASDRHLILENCAAMLSEDGMIHMTLRRGPLYEGRNIFLVDIEEIEGFASAKGLHFHYHGRTPDSSGLTGIEWDNISLWQGKAWAHAGKISA